MTEMRASKTNEFLQAHLSPVRRVARAHCSFLHLQLNSVYTFRPLLHVSPACLCTPASQPSHRLASQQGVLRVLSRTVTRIVYTYQMTLATWLSIGRLGCLEPAPPGRSRVSRSFPRISMSTFVPRWACFLDLVSWPPRLPAPAYPPNPRERRPMNASCARSEIKCV